MSKEKSVFVCSSCGGEHLQWQGKCQFCGEWNSLRELKIKNEKLKTRNKDSKTSEVVNLGKIESKDFKRISTGIGEFDRVLGPSTDVRAALSSQSSGQAGIVPGSVILIGGDPGIGKSTLLLQVANNLAKVNSNNQTPITKQITNSNPPAGGQNPNQINDSQFSTLSSQILYVSGEESANQVKMRLDRLPNKTDTLHFLAETDVDEIVRVLSKSKSERTTLTQAERSEASPYSVLIIDSIQTMYDSNFPSTPGSIVQVRECALKLQQYAKDNQVTIIMVGHMTKDGNVAGPKTLEHLVDVVLYLEGERLHSHRILRGAKNRFGATDEIGIFEMNQEGLKEVVNSSQLFLNERLKNCSGSVLTVAIEGTRPILIEIQALTAKTVFGYPKRTASGFDLNRLNLLIAVLSRKLRLALDSQDVYINVVGGYRLKDPGADLAIAMAIISAYKDKPIADKLCLFGEVGLLGEIRRVSYENKRVEEAKRLGFEAFVGCKSVEEMIAKIFK